MRFSQFATPSQIGAPFTPGVFATRYNGYFNDVVGFFATASVNSTAVVSTAINPFAGSTVPTNTSYQYLGYFKAPETGTLTFYLRSDDASYLWIGANALSGFTTGNSTINNGGAHGAVEVSATYAMTAGQYYPIRIQYGNGSANGVLTASYSSSAGKTSDLTGYIYYNKVTSNF